MCPALPRSVVPSSTKLGDVLASIAGSYDIVYGFDPSQGGATSYFTDPNKSFFNNLTDLQPLHGYWVHMTASGTLTISGQAVTTTNAVTLPLGWSLIGYSGTAAEPLSTALNNLGNVVDIVYGFDPSQGGATSYFTDPNKSFFNNLSSLAPNQGYWLHLTAAGQHWGGQ